MLTNSAPQPNREMASSVMAMPGFCTVQTGSGIGRHCQYSSNSARLENNTNVLRSVDGGTNRVQQRLKPCRAITLCCTANKPSSMVLMSALSISGPGIPESIDFGTTQLPTKPIAYTMAKRNTA